MLYSIGTVPIPVCEYRRCRTYFYCWMKTRQYIDIYRYIWNFAHIISTVYIYRCVGGTAILPLIRVLPLLTSLPFALIIPFKTFLLPALPFLPLLLLIPVLKRTYSSRVCPYRRLWYLPTSLPIPRVKQSVVDIQMRFQYCDGFSVCCPPLAGLLWGVPFRPVLW